MERIELTQDRDQQRALLFFENVWTEEDEVTGGCRKRHNEELHDLYCSPSIVRIITSRRMGWAGHVAGMGEKRNTYRLLVRNPEGKRSLGRPRHGWVVVMPVLRTLNVKASSLHVPPSNSVSDRYFGFFRCRRATDIITALSDYY
jgi:hypothetical protein